MHPLRWVLKLQQFSLLGSLLAIKKNPANSLFTAVRSSRLVEVCKSRVPNAIV